MAELQNFKDHLSTIATGMTRLDAHAKNVCIRCKKPVDETILRTEIERHEYSINGICGVCWDEVFGEPEEDLL